MTSPATHFLSLLMLVWATGCAGCGPDETPPADTGNDAGVDAVADVAQPARCPGTPCGEDRVCDEAKGRCVECLDSASCTDPLAPVCRGGYCVGCETDAQCTTIGGDGAMCRDDGRCVRCERDTDCPDTAPHCDASGACIRCVSDRDCPALQPACRDGACLSCTDADGCDDTDRLREILGLLCAEYVRLEGIASSATVAGTLAGLQAATCADATAAFLPSIHALLQSAAAGRMTIDEELFAACVSEQTSCADAFAPQVPDEKSCWIDAECISGRCSQDSCPGICEPTADVGEACAVESDCHPRLTCANTVCTEPPAVGFPCTTQCAPDAFCEGMTCRARRGESSSCDATYECQEGLYCDGSTATCTPLPDAGEACQLQAGFPCVEGVRCFKGICQQPGPEGEACEDSAQCEIGLRCVEGSCVEILLPGEPCEASTHCALGLGCIDGRCRPLPDVGEPCFEPKGCLRGHCSESTGRCVGLAEDDPCGPVPIYGDVFDPCGTDSTCSPDGTGSATCRENGDVGSACGGFEPPCRSPDLRCNGSGVCEAFCPAAAPGGPT